MKYQLRLYVIGQTPNSTRALENLKRICEEEMVGQYDLKVIDVLKDPHLAEQDKIIATPTLVKDLPPPLRKIIGDLSDRDKVLLGLDLVGAVRKNKVAGEPVSANEEAK